MHDLENEKYPEPAPLHPLAGLDFEASDDGENIL
jgi:hypothetical protein